MERIGQVSYRIIKEIGLDSEGNQRGRSRVFLADERSLGGKVAVKEIAKNNFPDPSNYFDEAHKMFDVHNQHVVPVQYMCEGVDIVSLVMRYFKRGSLSDKIEMGPISTTDVVKVGNGILSGLAAIHNADTFHFDIKPSNVLLSDSNIPMIADFGQARTVSPDGTVEWPGVYDLGLPPEWFSHSVGTSRSDIYQVGLTLYRAANGDPFFKQQIPHTDADLEDGIILGTFPKRNGFLPHVPGRLRKAIRTALSLNPTDRFASPDDFQNALTFDVGHDWKISGSGVSGLTRWTSKRKDKARIMVELEPQGKRWKVSIYKKGAKTTRHRLCDWRPSVTLNQAHRHLFQVFRSME